MIVRRIFPAVCLVGLLGCAAVPEYQPPALELPPGWKLEVPWRAGRPADAASKGAWWQIFDNPELDALEQKALANSPTLALAQARAALAATAAGALPQLGLSERAARQKISANRPLSNYASPNFSTVQNELSVSMTVNYEFDLAGRVQQTIAGAKASAEQVAADLENSRLLLTSDLVANYFNLREIDAELDLLGRAIALQRRALELVRARHDLGAASGLDLAQQQALLETTLVQLELLRRLAGGAPGVRYDDGTLRGRCLGLPGRGCGTAGVAGQRAPNGPVAGAAAGDHGISGQGAGRRLEFRLKFLIPQ